MSLRGLGDRQRGMERRLAGLSRRFCSDFDFGLLVSPDSQLRVALVSFVFALFAALEIGDIFSEICVLVLEARDLALQSSELSRHGVFELTIAAFELLIGPVKAFFTFSDVARSRRHVGVSKRR